MFYFLFFLLSGALGRILFVKGAIQVLWYCIIVLLLYFGNYRPIMQFPLIALKLNNEDAHL